MKAVLAVVSTIALATQAHAYPFTDITGSQNLEANGWYSANSGSGEYVEFLPGPADNVGYTDFATPADQTTIQTELESYYSVVYGGPFELVFMDAAATSGTSGTIVDSDPANPLPLDYFNVSVIKFGTDAMAFLYESGIDEWSFQGLEKDGLGYENHEISNYRLYACEPGSNSYCSPDPDPVNVSEPGNLALLALGLIGLYFARRKHGIKQSA